MNARKTVSLALFALTLATPAMAQSGTAVQNKRQTAPDPLALLCPRWSHPATSVGSKSPAPDAVALGLATAKVYRFSSADYTRIPRHDRPLALEPSVARALVRQSPHS
jgi:hypothetical protein